MPCPAGRQEGSRQHTLRMTAASHWFEQQAAPCTNIIMSITAGAAPVSLGSLAEQGGGRKQRKGGGGGVVQDELLLLCWRMSKARLAAAAAAAHTAPRLSAGCHAAVSLATTTRE